MSEKKLVYLATPYAGDVLENIQTAQNACRYAMAQGTVPIAVHLMYPQFLDDGSVEEREAGMQMGIRVLEACDELWLFGDRMSSEMQRELEAAEQLGIPVQRISGQELVSWLEEGPEQSFFGMELRGC